MKTKLSKKMTIPLLAVIVLVVGGAFVYGLLPRQTQTDKTTPTASFAFDSSEASGWYAGDPISSDASSASTDPTASRNIVQGTQSQPGDCFVTYSYYANNSKDPATALSDAEAFSTKGSKLSLQPTNIVPYVITTAVGSKSFDLHQFNVTGGEGISMSRGEEFGFVKAGTGYIDIRGYCKTADQLSQTASVFSAVSFKL
jgi:hypothetical protein